MTVLASPLPEVSSASVTLTLCAVMRDNGTMQEFPLPVPLDVNSDDIVRMGLYAGPRHTGALRQAQTTVFLLGKREGFTGGDLAYHVVESQSVLLQKTISAKRSVSGRPVMSGQMIGA